MTFKICKSSFPTVKYQGGGIFRLAKAHRIFYTARNVDCTIWICAGFLWDSASIPRVAWSRIGVTPARGMILPSLYHDLLYRTRGLTQPSGQPDIQHGSYGKNRFTRLEADQMLRDLMFFCREWRKAQILPCYWAVRVFGKRHFGGPAPKF